MSAKQQTLHRKLFLARKEAKAVEKKGDGDGFMFAKAEDVVAEAERLLEKRGIIVIPGVEGSRDLIGKNGNGNICHLFMTFEVVDTATGESFTKKWIGAGHDRPGDKAAYKAITGGEKYFLAKLLGIPFGDEDPESTGPAAETAEPEPGQSDEARKVAAEQDAAAEKPDLPPRVPPRERPLPDPPESDIEPDWDGLEKPEPAHA